jgi:predicted dehydrogenase
MGKAHSNAWRQAPRFFPLKARIELHTICGRQAAGVQAARAQFGWEKASTDWREVVESPLIEIVDICTTNDSHAEIAIAAAKAGKHVMCEKPLALNVKQAEAMFAAVQKAKVIHMVCHNYRRIPAIALARKMISEGTIGEIYHFHARYAQDRLVDPDYPLTWKMQREISGSGANGDINVHAIDLARYLVGEFTQVCGMMNTFIKERPLTRPTNRNPSQATKALERKGKVTVDDAVLFIGRFANGALANLEATKFALGRQNQLAFEINGSKGSLVFDVEDMNRLKYFDNATPADRQGFRDILVARPNVGQPYINQWWRGGQLLGYEHTFVHAVADFVNACVENKPVQPTFEDGLKNQQVLEAVELSAKKGQWVKV